MVFAVLDSLFKTVACGLESSHGERYVKHHVIFFTFHFTKEIFNSSSVIIFRENVSL